MEKTAQRVLPALVATAMAAPAAPVSSNARRRFAVGAAPRQEGFTAVRIDNVLTSPGRCFPSGLSGMQARLMTLACRNWLSR